MALSTEITKKIQDWEWIEGLAFDVLDSLEESQLNLTVGANMGTLGEQFRHMARVRLQYAEAIATGRCAKPSTKVDPSIATSKKGLIDSWNYANKVLRDAIQSQDTETLENLRIDWSLWGGKSMNIHDHLNALMDHETLHKGQLIVYLRVNNLPFPKSWAAWGL